MTNETTNQDALTACIAWFCRYGRNPAFRIIQKRPITLSAIRHSAFDIRHFPHAFRTSPP